MLHRRRETMAISFKGAHFPHDIILMGVRWGRVSDMHFTILHAMLMPSSEGEPHDTQCCALPPLSHRRGHEGWQDQSAHLKHDPLPQGAPPYARRSATSCAVAQSAPGDALGDTARYRQVVNAQWPKSVTELSAASILCNVYTKPSVLAHQGGVPCTG
jgi:hypothetical protein